MTLSTAVRNSSSNTIHNAAMKLRCVGRFPADRWLSARNHYALSTTIKLDREPFSKIKNNKNYLAEYIAASTILHCMDGWNFFSCAIDAFINQDFTSAIFMSYYAELRAIMSFFANEGIGIFNNKHYWFDSTGQVYFFTGKTHEVAKELIKLWSVEPPKNVRILTLMKYDGISFSDWLKAADLISSPRTSEFAKDWLLSWCIDLDIFAQDHIVRNEASYRPQGIFRIQNVDNFSSYDKFVCNIWRSSEPVNSNPFNSLDQMLLRNTLKAIYSQRTSKRPTGTNYNRFIESTACNLGLSPNSNIVRFLESNDNPNSLDFQKKALIKGQNHRGRIQVIPVLSRALLLLRLSSASVADLINKSGIEKQELSFWWSNFGESHGFWNDENIPERFTDLWADLEEVLNKIDEWVVSDTDDYSILDGFTNHSDDLWFLHQFQRIGLWSTGL